jgi:hypothetical protein
VKLRRREGYNDHPFYFQVTATAGLLAGIREVDPIFPGRSRPIVISGRPMGFTSKPGNSPSSARELIEANPT